MKVILDSSPLGLVTNPKRSEEAIACSVWLDRMLEYDHDIVVPEIIDYEIRRELLRANKWSGLKRLDEVKVRVNYLPLDTETLLLAAELWAKARQRGQPTAELAALDIDVILAAQALQYRDDGEFVIIATSNQKHLSQFVPAENWKDIHPL
jgi:predicted nucleic acid-binding protein